MFPKRGAIALVTTALALVLLFQFNPSVEVSGGVSASTGSAAVTSPSAGSAAVTSPSAGASAPAATSATAKTLTGSVISTRYGDVEVQITVANGKITAVDAIALPSGGRSGQISSSVGPILADEALTAQSANIDIVSGATYTSEAYAQSLQAALDQAAITTSQATG
jgi:uncharacterized protein with FMN-binding domain